MESNVTVNADLPEDKSTGILRRPTKRQPVKIEFEDLCYSVGKKIILKSINGKFSPGHLTAILGSSGAGKTSLLNVVSGMTCNGVDGSISVNGKPREMKKFHKMSCYIMQEDLLQPFLSVREAMTVAAKLKIGSRCSPKEIQAAINQVITLIGLDSCLDTEVENLSGGQKKRLSIALELVNNPPVIFLDEPTTGLDNVTMKHCIEILKSLTLQGCTVVCTIHQPSDLVFNLFDQVYFMSNGYCIYNGDIPGIVHFLSNVNLPCPTTYSPADYIIELVNFNKHVTTLLSQAIENGRQRIVTGLLGKKELAEMGESADMVIEEGDYSSLNAFPTTFWEQFWVLSTRMLKQTARNRTVLVLQFGHHILSGFFLGAMFQNVGNDSTGMLLNSKLFYAVVVYFLYTHVMSPALLYPFEVKLLQREYFNRWYSLKAYYMAANLTMQPLLIIPALMFIAIIYSMTNQPPEADRFIMFTVICLLMAATSQGFGYAIGSLFQSTNGACIGSALCIPLILLGIYGFGYGDDIPPAMKFLMSVSFPRRALVGLSTAVFKDRPMLDCKDVLCYFRDPLLVLRIAGMEGESCYVEAASLAVFMVLHRLITYLFLRFRVTPDAGFSAYRWRKVLK